MIGVYKITALNLLARSAHLLLFLIIGNRFGATASTDTVLLLQAPLLVVMTVSTGVTDVIVMPVMHRASLSRSSITLLRKFRFFALLVTVPLAVIAVLAGAILSTNATLLMCLILLPMPLFSILSGMHVGILNSCKMHGRAAIGPLYGGGAAIPLLIVLPPAPETIAVALLVFEVAKYTGLRFHSYSRIKALESHIKEDKLLLSWALKGAFYQAIGSFILAMNFMIDVVFAAQLSSGSVSLVEYSNRLWNLVPLLLIGFVTVAYEHMSRLAAKNELVSSYVHNTALKLGLYALVLSILASIACHPVVEIVYGYGTMGSDERDIFSTLIIFYLIGAAPFLVGQVYVKAHSAMGHPKVMTVVAFIGIFINILGNILLIPVLGIYGIGLATAVTYLFSAFFLGYLFSQRAKDYSNNSLVT